VRSSASQSKTLLPRVRVSALDALESLHQPHGSITRLSQRKLLAKTDPRTTVEGKIFPTRPETLLTKPALRAELVRIFAEKVLAAVHGVHMPDDDAVFCDEERRFAIWPAADGENCVADRLTRVSGHDGVEAQGLVQDRAEVLEVFQLLEGRMRAV